MSCKIYDAYRVKKHNALETVFRIKDDLSGIFTQKVIEILLKNRRKPIGDIFYDQQRYIEKYSELFKNGINTVFDKLTPTEIILLYEQKHRLSRNGDPFDFNMSMVHYYDPATKFNFVQFFGLNRTMEPCRDYIKALVKKRVLRDYHWQDQTDDDWDNPNYLAREAVWERIMAKSDTPSACGFSFDFWNNDVVFKYWEQLMELKLKEKQAK